MQITKRTRLKELLPLLTDKERLDSVLDGIEEYPLKKDVISMNIGEFSEIVLDEEAWVKKMFRPNERAYKALGRVKNYKRQMEQLMNWIKKFNIKQTADEKQAAIGVDFPDFISRMLITVTEFFKLSSFKEAEKVPLADYLLILQDQSSSIQYQRNYQKIIDLKNKSKNKKK